MLSPRIISKDHGSPTPRNLIAMLLAQASSRPNVTAFEYISTDDAHSRKWTYAELADRSRGIADFLSQVTIESGSRVVLLYPQGLDAIASLFGCFQAGVVPIPLPPINASNRLSELPEVLRRLRVRAVLSTHHQIQEIKSRQSCSMEEVPLAWIPTDRIKPHFPGGGESLPVSPQSLALPRSPTGRTELEPSFYSHEEVMEKLSLVSGAMGGMDAGPLLSWLPLYHGHGLFYTVLLPVYVGKAGILLDPNAFVANPIRWMHAMSRCRAVTGISPDFGYDLCVRTTAKERSGLDLSQWSRAMSINHPISASLKMRFTQVFAPYGFRDEAFERGEKVPPGLYVGGLQTTPSSLLSLRSHAKHSSPLVASAERQTSDSDGQGE
ncbi:MAG: AMP-binding protein [Planctomycetota bacterium]